MKDSQNIIERVKGCVSKPLKALSAAYRAFKWEWHVQSVTQEVLMKELHAEIAKLSGTCVNECDEKSKCSDCPLPS